MSSWSKRRRFVYAGTVAVIVIVAIIIPAFFIFYQAPTCFDGVINGNELGVDCGGSCEKVCNASFIPIKGSSWARYEQVAPELYNIAAYIVNPNTDGEAKNVPYLMQIYDNTGVMVTEITGKVTLPPHRNTLAFKPAVNLGKRIPASVYFEFTGAPDWNKKTDPLAKVSVKEQEYTEDDKGSSLMVKLQNDSLESIGPVTVYAVLYDKENAIGFSKTIVDEIKGKDTAIAPFTWPINRNGTVVVKEVLPVIE